MHGRLARLVVDLVSHRPHSYRQMQSMKKGYDFYLGNPSPPHARCQTDSGQQVYINGMFVMFAKAMAPQR